MNTPAASPHFRRALPARILAACGILVFGAASIARANFVALGWDITGQSGASGVAPAQLLSTVNAEASPAALDFFNANGYDQTGGAGNGLDTRSPFTNLAANAYQTRGIGGTADAGSLSFALTNDDYLTFTLTPTGLIDLVEFNATVGYQAPSNGGNGGQVIYSLLTDLDGNGTFEAGDLLGSVTVGGTNAAVTAAFSVDLTGFTALQGVSSPREFRIYVYNGGTATGVGTWTGVNQAIGLVGDGTSALDVTLTAVPEPETYALALAGLLVAVAFHRGLDGRRRMRARA